MDPLLFPYENAIHSTHAYLRILEYPLSLVYELYKQPSSPLPQTRLLIDHVNPARVYFFTHALSTYRHVHVMYLGNLQAEAWRGCRPRPD